MDHEHEPLGQVADRAFEISRGIEQGLQLVAKLEHAFRVVDRTGGLELGLERLGGDAAAAGQLVADSRELGVVGVGVGERLK